MRDPSHRVDTCDRNNTACYIAKEKNKRRHSCGSENPGFMPPNRELLPLTTHGLPPWRKLRRSFGGVLSAVLCWGTRTCTSTRSVNFNSPNICENNPCMTPVCCGINHCLISPAFDAEIWSTKSVACKNPP